MIDPHSIPVDWFVHEYWAHPELGGSVAFAVVINDVTIGILNGAPEGAVSLTEEQFTFSVEQGDFEPVDLSALLGQLVLANITPMLAPMLEQALAARGLGS